MGKILQEVFVEQPLALSCLRISASSINDVGVKRKGIKYLVFCGDQTISMGTERLNIELR
jgi:hypothetical protein